MKPLGLTANPLAKPIGLPPNRITIKRHEFDRLGDVERLERTPASILAIERLERLEPV